MGKDALDKVREIRHAYRRASQPCNAGQEVLLVTLSLRLTSCLHHQLDHHLHQASANGVLRLVKRRQALRAMTEGLTVHDVVQRVDLGEQTVRDDRHRCRWQGGGNGVSTRSLWRPAQRPNTLRKARTTLIAAGPRAAGSPADSWCGTLLPNRLHRRLGVAYPPHAHFVAAPRDAAPRLAWRPHTWPQMLRAARMRIALLRLGDEASGAPWDSMRSPWSPQAPRSPVQGQTPSGQGLGAHRRGGRTRLLPSPDRGGAVRPARPPLGSVSSRTPHHRVGACQRGHACPSQALLQVFTV